MDCALFLVIRFNSSYCGLNSGWACLVVFFILCGAYTWSAVPLGCPTPHSPLMMLLSHNRSCPFHPSNAPDIPNTRSHKEIHKGQHCGCLSIPQREAPTLINYLVIQSWTGIQHWSLFSKLANTNLQIRSWNSQVFWIWILVKCLT